MSYVASQSSNPDTLSPQSEGISLRHWIRLTYLFMCWFILVHWVPGNTNIIFKSLCTFLTTERCGWLSHQSLSTANTLRGVECFTDHKHTRLCKPSMIKPVVYVLQLFTLYKHIRLNPHLLSQHIAAISKSVFPSAMVIYIARLILNDSIIISIYHQ